MMVAAIALACSGPAVEREELDAVEDLSESLANDLLDLSVATRRQDLAQMAEYFPLSLEAIPFPDKAKEAVEQTTTARAHGWAVEREPLEMSREQFLAHWADFLAHFSAIEDYSRVRER